MRIAVITTCPIQYHAPLFSYLSKHFNQNIKIFYTLGNQEVKTFDRDFGIERTWNIDLLSGYSYEYLKNIASRSSLDLFWGIQNPFIIDKVEEYRPSIILVFGWKHHSHLRIMRYFKSKVPILFRGDSTTLDDASRNSILNTFRYLFLKWVYRYVDFALSPGLASDQYFKKVGIRSNKIIRAPHSVDTARFGTFSVLEQNNLNRLRGKLKISTDDFVFLFAGKFMEKKNPFLLLKAFAMTAESNTNFKLLLVGNGNLELKMKHFVASLPKTISNRIYFLPFQDQNQMKIVYRIASVFVLPSISETWGLSVNESLASGTPVIVSNKCGCAFDLVKHGVNGLIFESNNAEDLCINMKLISDNNFYQQVQSGINNELDNFSFRSFKEALEKVATQIEN